MVFLIWLIFAILGVSLMKNKMGYCDVDDYYKISKDQVQIYFIIVSGRW